MKGKTYHSFYPVCILGETFFIILCVKAMIAQTLRKAFASVSAAAVLLTTLIVPGMGVNFAQAQPGHWGYNMYETSYFDLDAVNETFGDNLNANITRGEYVRLVLIVSGLEVGPLTVEEAGNRAKDLGIIFGQNNDANNLGLDSVLNRAEAVTIARRANAELSQYPATATLADLDTGAWYGESFQQSISAGVIVGREVNGVRQAAPAGSLTRAEGMALAYQAFRAVEALLAWQDAGNTGVPSTSQIVALDALDVFNLVVEFTFSGDDVVTPTPEEPTIGGGTLLVEVSPNTPPPQNIPNDAASIRYSTIRLSASNGDVVVTSITVQRFGLGDDEDFDDVWGTDPSGVRITAQRGLTFTDRVELPFQPALILRSGESIDVGITAELAGNANNSGRQNAFGINSASDVAATGTVTGAFPVKGNELEIANYAIGGGAITRQGTARTVDVGSTEVELGEFKYTDESDANNTDVCLVAITLEVEGSVDREDLVNLALYRANERVTEIVSEVPESEKVTFRWLPTLDRNGNEIDCYFLADGNNRTFTIRGDLISGTENDTIIFEFDNSSDIVINVIGLTGYQPRIIGNATFPANATTLNNLQLRTQTINAGDLAFAEDPSGRDVQDLAPDTDDVDVLTLRVTVPVAVEVKSIQFNINYTDNVAPFLAGAADPQTTVDASLDNYRLVLLETNGEAVSHGNNLASNSDLAFVQGGRTLASEQSTTGVVGAITGAGLTGASGVAAITFSDDFTLPSGVHLIAFVLDIEPGAPVTDVFSVTYAGANTVVAEYVESGDVLVANRITGGASVGSSFTINTATLTWQEVSGIPAGDPLVRGTIKALLAVYNVNNNDVEPVEVTDVAYAETVAVGLNGNTISDMSVVSNCFLAVKDANGSVSVRGDNYRQISEVDDFEEPDTTMIGDSTMNFDQVSVTIDTNQQATIYLFCDIATSATLNQLQVNIVSVQSEDDDGDSATNVTGTPAVTIAAAAPVTSIRQTVSAGGVLTVSIDPSTTDTDIVVGDGSGVEQAIAILKFSAEDDQISIKDLILNVTNNVFTARVSKVLLYSLDKSVKYDEATVVNSTVLTGAPSGATNIAQIALSMASSARVPVAKDKNYRALLVMLFNDITEIIQSHKLLRVYLDESFVIAGSKRSVEAVSESTGQDLGVGTIKVSGNSSIVATNGTCSSVSIAAAATGTTTYFVANHGYLTGQTIMVTQGASVAPVLVVGTTANTVTVTFTASTLAAATNGAATTVASNASSAAIAAGASGTTTYTFGAPHNIGVGASVLSVGSFVQVGQGASVACAEILAIPSTTTLTVRFTASTLAGATAAGDTVATAGFDVLRHAIAGGAPTVAALNTTIVMPAGHGFDNGDVVSFYDVSAGAVVNFGAGTGAVTVTATSLTFTTADFPGLAGGYVAGDLVIKTGTQTLVADDFLLYASKLTVSSVNLNSSNIGFSSNDEIYRFKVSADAAGDADFASVVFQISQTDTDVQGFVLKEVNQSGNVIQNPILAATATRTVGAQTSTASTITNGATAPFNLTIAATEEYVVESTVRLVPGATCADLAGGAGTELVARVTAIVSTTVMTVTPTTATGAAVAANCVAGGVNGITVFPFVGGDASAGEQDSGLVRLILNVSQEISQGTSKTYQLEAQTSDQGGQDFNQVSTIVKEETAAAAQLLAVGTAASRIRLGAHFVWSDQPNTAQHVPHTYAGAGTPTATAFNVTLLDYLTGFLLDNLPTQSKNTTN